MIWRTTQISQDAARLEMILHHTWSFHSVIGITVASVMIYYDLKEKCSLLNYWLDSSNNRSLSEPVHLRVRD